MCIFLGINKYKVERLESSVYFGFPASNPEYQDIKITTSKWVNEETTLG